MRSPVPDSNPTAVTARLQQPPGIWIPRAITTYLLIQLKAHRLPAKILNLLRLIIRNQRVREVRSDVKAKPPLKCGLLVQPGARATKQVVFVDWAVVLHGGRISIHGDQPVNRNFSL
jgi:hypothetical protein